MKQRSNIELGTDRLLDSQNGLSQVERLFVRESFGKIELTSHKSIQQGLLMYLGNIKQQLKQCSYEKDRALASLLQSYTQPPEAPLDRFFTIATAVATILRESDNQASIHEITEKVIDKLSIPEAEKLNISPSDSLSSVYNFIFACIGWTSALFLADKNLSVSLFKISPPVHMPNQMSLSRDIHLRPIKALLKERGVLPIGIELMDEQCDLENGRDDTLRLSVVNSDSVLGIGKLSIVWDDALANHCYLNKEKRALHLFKSPAILLQCFNSKAEGTVLSCVIESYRAEYDSSTHQLPVDRLIIDIIHSYQLLFELNKKSRDRFRREQISHADLDPTLARLSKITSHLNIPPLEKKDTYLASNEFPQLASRLLKLQSYVHEQRPTKFWDIWQDHRDVAIFHTFWAVIIIGAISIVLSLIQAAVSIAQLVYSVRQVP